MKKRIVIIGGGPAGLSTAYELLKADCNIEPVIVEMEDCVGGLAKTVFDEEGNGTDIGPHRFHSKNNEVMEQWNEILPFQGKPAKDDILLSRKIDFDQTDADPEKSDKVFLKRKRFSRIYYKKHFLDYPIKLKAATVFAMGIPTTIVAGFSYLKSCLRKLPETNLETFMINRFGRVLYQLFFEGYTQKVWGLHPSKISKDWGAQRIKGISLVKVLVNAVLTPLNLMRKKEISLIDEYHYPKFGSQQLWETMADEITRKGCEIILNSEVVNIVKTDDKITSIKVKNTKTGETREIFGDMFVSSMPVKDLITGMNDVPDDIYEIAKNLSYRDYILVNYLVNKINLKNNTDCPTVNNIAPDSWIYLQDDGVKAGRLDIMNNFSPYIIKNWKNDVVINLEYFCNENDDFWNMSDKDITEFGLRELKNLNVTDCSDIKTSKVIRIKKAYPSYFGSYEKFSEIKEYINKLDNLYCIGRNGQHKYNNMDHSVLSGIIASRVILQNLDKNLLWDVNTDSEYQETKSV